jgi:hypothetical protein
LNHVCCVPGCGKYSRYYICSKCKKDYYINGHPPEWLRKLAEMDQSFDRHTIRFVSYHDDSEEYATPIPVLKTRDDYDPSTGMVLSPYDDEIKNEQYRRSNKLTGS